MKRDKKANNEEPVLLAENSDKQDSVKEKKQSKKAKRAIVISICVMAVLGGISWYVLYGRPEILENTAEKIKDDIIGMYGSNNSYIYYPIDDSLDVTLVDEYMQLDRNIYYTDGAETFILTEENGYDFPSDAEFFKKYFEYAINGNYQSYNALFTDNYYKKNEPYKSFTQQMIYDIHVEKLSEDTDNSSGTVYSYNVSYKIFRNNGTFRNDIGSDGSKTLYFELVEQNGNILIDKIDYYV